MRILVVGRGSIAQRHVRCLRAVVPEVQLAVLSAGEPVAAFAPFEQLGNWQDASQWGPDGVVVASVSSRHADELLACMAAGWPCLVEKPLVVQRSQWSILRRFVAAQAKPQSIVVGCNLRYLGSLQKARQVLQRGDLGRIVRAHLEVGQDLRLWREGRRLDEVYSSKSALGGGVLLDLVHEVDLARWMLGPMTVCAGIAGQWSRPLMDAGVCTNDVQVALLKLQSGAPVTLSLDYVSRRLVRRHVFVGENGTLTWDLVLKRCWIESADDTVEVATMPQDFDMSQTYAAQMHDWIASIFDPQRQVLSSLSDGMDTAELMLDILDASA